MLPEIGGHTLTTVEIVSSVVLGLGVGLFAIFFPDRRSLGVAATLLLGALGGLLGAGVGHAAFARFPWTWGSLGYHPMDGAGAVVGGVIAIIIGRLILGRSTDRGASKSAT